MKRGIKKTVAACCIALMLLYGCTKSAGTESADTKDTVYDLTEQEENLSDTDEDTAEDTDSMFTDRDKEVGYDENECTAIQLSDDGFWRSRGTGRYAAFRRTASGRAR